MTAAAPGPLLTLGETLAVLRADRPGPLDRGQPMFLSIAGAESNVAIGVSRLGHPAAFIGRVGADSLGALVHSSLLGAGITVQLCVDPTRPTGLMLVEQRMHDVRQIYYYRRGSAGSALTPDNIDPQAVAGAGLLHITGITPVLSDTAAVAVAAAVSHARACGAGQHRPELPFSAGLAGAVPAAGRTAARAVRGCIRLAR
jgi:2-dehydro-3-deoxygluconokinase